MHGVCVAVQERQITGLKAPVLCTHRDEINRVNLAANVNAPPVGIKCASGVIVGECPSVVIFCA